MTEPHKRANRHPKYKMAYRVKNWREYDKSLRDRGDITLWISQDAIDAWTPPQTGKRGVQPVYSDVAIETALSLRLLFRLPLRQPVLSDFAPTGAKPCFPPFATYCFYSPREGMTVSHPTPKSQFGAKSDKTKNGATIRQPTSPH